MIPQNLDLQARIGHEVYPDENLWWAMETFRRRERLRLMLEMPIEADRLAVLRADEKLCRADPVYWIENYAWMFDPKQDEPERRKVPAVLFPKQVELVRWLLEGLEGEGRTRLILKGRELGVSWNCLFLIYHRFWLETHFTAKLGSRKEELVDDGTIDSLFGKLEFIQQNQPAHLQPPVQKRFLKMKNQATRGEIIGEATNAGFGRGGRRRVVLVDEFAHVETMLQPKIWTGLESVAKSRWLPSTPSGPGNKFGDLVKTLPPEDVFVMDWTTDVRRPADFKAKKIASGMRDDEFAQEHEAKIVTLRTGRVWNVRLPLIEYDDATNDFIDLGKPMERFPLFGGWDFGSGASLLCCLFGMLEMGREKPRLWIDAELAWQHTSWRQAATDARQVMARYQGRHMHFGDPAGTQPDSDQQSWESNLRQGGMPLMCLDSWHNTRDGIEWGLKEVQAWFDDGRIRIRRSCSYLWEVVENWRRDVPEGAMIDYISRAYIPPRHDVFSHGGMALVYLIGGVSRAIQSSRGNARHAQPARAPGIYEPGEDRFGQSGYGNPLAGGSAPLLGFGSGAPGAELATVMGAMFDNKGRFGT